DPAICRKLEAYATQKSDSYFSNAAEQANVRRLSICRRIMHDSAPHRWRYCAGADCHRCAAGIYSRCE
ncbi:MAG TPA: hypothetical protein PLF81_25715, partial [Candidatus Anammoximicrobium sp.]|nr:hypothetical protein [Candidatus Anammoximicrobium sp.]